ncbi:MAG: type II toxin-antitoxin system RelE/ParE family toxin [Rubrobacteraceae bacterium]
MSEEVRYELVIPTIIAKELRKIRRGQPRDFERIEEVAYSLADNPLPVGSRELSGRDDEYRVRVGDYRIIYAVNDEQMLVEVLRVAHRREVYRKR